MCGLTSMSIPELAGLMEELGQPKFRARQVFEWISRGKRPQEMTNLPKELRDKLDTLHYGGASIYDKRVSAKDGTVKYLFQLPGVDKGPQPLIFNPALTTCASERMKTQRFSYFAGFAARELMREAKPVKARKSGVQPLFRKSHIF